MARRRMFSAEVVSDDVFLDMPASSQALYFHLGIQADDDGFVSPKKVMRMAGANEDDLKILHLKGFTIPFEGGVVVIRHWKANNYIPKDRYSPTTHLKEKRMLELDGNVYQMSTVRIQNVDVGRELGKKGDKKVKTPHISSLKKPKFLEDKEV